MKELWDIYDRDRSLTGVIKERGRAMESGEYHLVVLAWIKGYNDKYLISERAKNLDGAGKWQTTGGSVLSGEVSIDGVIREVKEEIGLDFSSEQLELLKSTFIGKSSGWIADYWFIHEDIDINTVVCQEEEVASVKWASLEEIEDLIKDNQFFHGQSHIDFINEIKKR